MRAGTRLLAGAPGFAALLAAYLATHAGLRLLLSRALTIDDAHETVLSQTLAWGYEARQPPLYNWLLWGGYRLLGLAVHTPVTVKYAVLGLAYAFVYGTSRRILREPGLPTLATFSLLLLLPVGWAVHEDLTHSVAVLAACAATVYALLRVGAGGGAGAYLGLGAALGSGLLAKFTFVPFAAVLLAAALTLPPYRRRLLDPRMLLALAVAGLLALPYLLWLAAADVSLARLYAIELRVRPGAPWPTAALAGLSFVGRVTLYYLAPLGLVLLVLCPRLYTTRLPPDGSDAVAGRLVERTLLGAFGLLVAGALAGGLAYLKFRWLIPAYFLLPVYAVWRLDRLGLDERVRRRLAGVLLGVGLGIAAAFALRIVTGDLLGRPWRLNAPYDRVMAAIGAEGFTRGTIVSDGPLAGHLRLAFPAARVVSADSPQYLPPSTGQGECLVAWEVGRTAGVPGDIQALLRSRLDATLAPDARPRLAELGHRFAPRRPYRAAWLRFPDGLGRCR
jgi:4-amino-4-deoxy-L-arabinose transferase-like glycosyltransferase